MPELEQMPEAHVYQAYGMYFLSSRHRIIEHLKRNHEPSIHGHRLWDSGFVLIDYLLHNPVRTGVRVMDIGCGWGSGAVFCARRFDAQAVGIDLDKQVFPYLEVLAELNDVSVVPLQANFVNLTGLELAQQEVLIGADVCFWDSLVKPLFTLVERAIDCGVSRVVLADPGRPTFYELADSCIREPWRTTLKSWYAVEPSRATGEVLEVRP